MANFLAYGSTFTVPGEALAFIWSYISLSLVALFWSPPSAKGNSWFFRMSLSGSLEPILSLNLDFRLAGAVG